MFESLEQALAILRDPQEDSLKRVDAVHYLADLGTEDAIQAMLEALEDDDYGVRWAVADELAKMGKRGAEIMARKMLDPNASSRVFEMALHVFKDNGDLLVRSKAERLVKALESGHTIEAMTEAGNLLKELMD